ACTGGEFSSLGPVLMQYNGAAWQIVATAGAQPGFERTAAEITAGVTPTSYIYPSLNVLRYGADSTGIADSLAAFNAASLVANTGGGGTVTIPAGTFKLTGTLLFYVTPNLGQVVFQGAGKVATTLNYTGAGSAVGVSAASTRIYDCGVR